MLEDVTKFISEYQNTPLSSIGRDTHLIKDLGMSSLDLMQLTCSLEDEYGVLIEDDEVFNLLTVQKITDYIESKIAIK